MHKLEIFGGKLDVILLEAALIQMTDKLYDEGDKYNVLDDAFNMLEQVQYIKANWEDN